MVNNATKAVEATAGIKRTRIDQREIQRHGGGKIDMGVHLEQEVLVLSEPLHMHNQNLRHLDP